ncbi:MAG: hypothetical protein JWP61_1939 [Friedmanniella sp.]|nr:hypothetical protein [Friedmanniella sp.]
MGDSFWTAFAQRAVEVQARARTRAAGRPEPRPSPGRATGSSSSSGGAPRRFGRRLAAVVPPPRRVVAVQSGTLALVFGEDEVPEVRRPGDLLRPHLRAVRNPRSVLVVNTEPVTLDVAMQGLRTVDRQTVLEVVVRVRVRFAADHLEQHLVDLVLAVGADLEPHLLDTVRAEVAEAVQGAIRSNRLTDLHRHLPQLLDLNWLPATLADGHLERLSVEVLWVGWPEGGSPPERVTTVFPSPGRAVEPSPTPTPEPTPGGPADPDAAAADVDADAGQLAGSATRR